MPCRSSLAAVVRIPIDFAKPTAPSELTEDVARFIARANCVAGIKALIYEHHGDDPRPSIAAEAASTAGWADNGAWSPTRDVFCASPGRPSLRRDLGPRSTTRLCCG